MMANYIKRPSQNGWLPTKGSGLASYASKDRYTDELCKGKTCARVNPLSEAELNYCKSQGIKNLCYNCQRKEAK